MTTMGVKGLTGDVTKGFFPIGINLTVPWCVCLSVWHVRALCSNGRRYRHDFFCVRQRLFQFAL